MAVLAVLFSLIVSAPNRDYTLLPVSVVVPAQPAGTQWVMKRQGSDEPIPCQLVQADGTTRLWFVVRDLKKGQSQTFRVMKAPAGAPAAGTGVGVKQGEKDVEVTLDGKLFTRYVFAGALKPYCYPIIGPTGMPMTRAYPMEQVAGEDKDHPHHRGMWLTHGAINGMDFWAETPKSAPTVHRAFEAVEGGPVLGRIRARNDWMGLDGKRVLNETREVRIYDLGPDVRVLDYESTLRAADGDVVFGDTKEGSFGIRVPKSLQLTKGGQGHIETSRGDRDGAAWGKQAEWCDYYGPVGDQTVGISIFDTPGSYRYPTYWHVRDYGLFAANPWGLHDFLNLKNDKENGQDTLARGKSITLRYRVIFHKGTTAEAKVADLYAQYIDPPKVEVKK